MISLTTVRQNSNNTVAKLVAGNVYRIEIYARLDVTAWHNDIVLV